MNNKEVFRDFRLRKMLVPTNNRTLGKFLTIIQVILTVLLKSLLFLLGVTPETRAIISFTEYIQCYVRGLQYMEFNRNTLHLHFTTFISFRIVSNTIFNCITPVCVLLTCQLLSKDFQPFDLST